MAITAAQLNSKARGCLLAGAAGDALGYTVEFDLLDDIREMYGPLGIRSYRLSPDGKAQISDDTQMTLFTAAGILAYAEAQKSGDGASYDILHYIRESYYDWLRTQQTVLLDDEETLGKLRTRKAVSWLADVKELYALRAPGNTCLNALAAFEPYDRKNRANERKGCGGIMRVAPVGIYGADMTAEAVILLGAETAALTHGHPLGYIPAGILAGIVHAALYGDQEEGIESIVRRTVQTAHGIFAGPEAADDEPGAMAYVEELVDMAILLAHNAHSDTDNILLLGEGWVAEETLAIAVYCAVRHEEDLGAALIAAVNHDGDSDSTGAVTGNMLGALLGVEALEETWTKDLELADLIAEMAKELIR